MVGLGCGARSYTSALHYSWRYAVSREGIREILDDYVTRTEAQFAVADYGIELDREEQSGRFVLLSLLQAEGLDLLRYQQRFGGPPEQEHPALAELRRADLAEVAGDVLRLTPRGLELSDAIGPWFYSQRVHTRMEEFPWS